MGEVSTIPYEMEKWKNYQSVKLKCHVIQPSENNSLLFLWIKRENIGQRIMLNSFEDDKYREA